jgi:phosphohistidine phosphatase
MDDIAAHTLVVLRHAKSDWSGGEPDRLRPLAERGRRQAPGAGRWLAAHLDHLDLALVSPALRARSTWELVSAELADPPPTRLEEGVYAASGDALLELVRGMDDALTTVVLVGHNPGLEDLVESLVDQWVHLPTSAIAVVTLAGRWADAGPATAALVTSGRPPA